MEKEKVVKVFSCDFCGEESYTSKCLECGKDICYKCVSKGIVAKEYKHSVYFSGSGDGVYCRECNMKLYGTYNSLHQAYRNIENLRMEYDAWYKSFEERSKDAEGTLERMLKEETK